MSVPFALVGSVWLVYFLGYDYSTATLGDEAAKPRMNYLAVAICRGFLSIDS
jgi:hypothetical protein